MNASLRAMMVPAIVHMTSAVPMNSMRMSIGRMVTVAACVNCAAGAAEREGDDGENEKSVH